MPWLSYINTGLTSSVSAAPPESFPFLDSVTCSPRYRWRPSAECIYILHGPEAELQVKSAGQETFFLPLLLQPPHPSPPRIRELNWPPWETCSLAFFQSRCSALQPGFSRRWKQSNSNEAVILEQVINFPELEIWKCKKKKKMEMVRILRASGTDFRALPEVEAINYGEHLMPAYDRHAPSTGLLGRWLSH